MAHDSPTKERLLRNHRRQCQDPWDVLADPPPSVHNRLFRLLSFEGLQNCVITLPSGLSQYTLEKRPVYHVFETCQTRKNLKRLALLTHTQHVLRLVSPASHGLRAVSSLWAICPQQRFHG